MAAACPDQLFHTAVHNNSAIATLRSILAPLSRISFEIAQVYTHYEHMPARSDPGPPTIASFSVEIARHNTEFELYYKFLLLYV